MKKRPVIGIVPLVDETKESYWMLPGYIHGILQSGGLPLTLPLTTDQDQIIQICNICNGILLTGGHDIHPSYYGMKKITACGNCCPERDEMEPLLFQQALKQNIPILGICRGLQMLNVILGGTLYQDLPQQFISTINHHQSPPYDQPVHTVKILPDTPLHIALKKETLSVNSYHHQGIQKLASPLKAMAIAEDGLIEGVYLPNKKFIWGIQWHPEFSYLKDCNSQIIFRYFVQASSLP